MFNLINEFSNDIENQGSFFLFQQDMKDFFFSNVGYSKKIKLTCF
jgi:hypothetical protein